MTRATRIKARILRAMVERIWGAGVGFAWDHEEGKGRLNCETEEMREQSKKKVIRDAKRYCERTEWMGQGWDLVAIGGKGNDVKGLPQAAELVDVILDLNLSEHILWGAMRNVAMSDRLKEVATWSVWPISSSLMVLCFVASSSSASSPDIVRTLTCKTPKA